MTPQERLRLKSYVKTLRKRASVCEADARRRDPEAPLLATPEGGKACALRAAAAEIEEMLSEFSPTPQAEKWTLEIEGKAEP